MSAPRDEKGRTEPDPAGSTTIDETFPPVLDGDPAANPPLPFDDAPVPPLTEPTDINGG
jgi:hypothetical protein